MLHEDKNGNYYLGTNINSSNRIIEMATELGMKEIKTSSGLYFEKDGNVFRYIVRPIETSDGYISNDISEDWLIEVPVIKVGLEYNNIYVKDVTLFNDENLLDYNSSIIAESRKDYPEWNKLDKWNVFYIELQIERETEFN